MDDDVSVKELIQRVSKDLLESEQERTSDGRRAVFQVAELTIDLSFEVSRSRQGHGGVDLKVVSVGGQLDRSDARTQRMTLRLVATGGARPDPDDDEALSALDYDDALPVRPRLRGRVRE